MKGFFLPWVLLVLVAAAVAGGLWWSRASAPSTAGAPAATSTAPGSAASSSSGGGQGLAPYHSGIMGSVVLGPTCPVEQNPPQPQCADKPYQTLVAVFRASDPVHAVALLRSDASGNFKIALPPGSYTLGAGESNLPRCNHPAATVPAEGYAQVAISCDTGIR